MDVDIEYEFDLESETSVDYRCSKLIIEWLKQNMESLTDSKGSKLFSKVNYGYNEDTLKGFGKKPVCDVYINSIGLSTDMTLNQPATVTSFIICYLKGNMNNAYIKACELVDYIIQEFMTNPDFRENSIIYETEIKDIQITIAQNSKTYGVICAFELEHKIKR